MSRFGILRHSKLWQVAVLALAVSLGAASGCASTPSESALPPDDINVHFLDTDMQVEQWLERFEGESRAVYAERFAIVDALGLEPGDDVADIGAGTGFFTYLFADAVGAEGTAYAVEISPRFLDHLREQKVARSLGHMQVVEGTTRSVELPADSIDLAFVCDVYHHFEAPQDSLASLMKAVRPGGELVLIEFHRIPGETSDFIMGHVRAGRLTFQSEIEEAGFRFVEEIEIDRLDDNYVLRFQRPPAATP